MCEARGSDKMSHEERLKTEQTNSRTSINRLYYNGCAVLVFSLGAMINSVATKFDRPSTVFGGGSRYDAEINLDCDIMTWKVTGCRYLVQLMTF